MDNVQQVEMLTSQVGVGDVLSLILSIVFYVSASMALTALLVYPNKDHDTFRRYGLVALIVKARSWLGNPDLLMCYFCTSWYVALATSAAFYVQSGSTLYLWAYPIVPLLFWLKIPDDMLFDVSN